MSHFAVQYTYVSDQAALDLVRPRHRAYLATLVGDSLVASGPYPGAQPPAALLLFRAADEAAVTALLDADPFWQEGLIEHRSVRQWDPVLGNL